VTWLILSLLTALAVSTQDAWVKKYFSHLSAYDMAAYPALYSLPCFAIGLCFVAQPPLDGVYLLCLLTSLPLNGISFVLYMRAIKVSPLSLTLPYLAFTPVFMILTGTLILDEWPNQWGTLGIVTTCLGGYILNLGPGRFTFRAPFKAFAGETGSWLMLIVAFIFSFAAVVGKKGIMHSSVLFFTFSFFTLFNLVFVLMMIATGAIRPETYTRPSTRGLVAGILFFVQAVCHGAAISLVAAAYMISIKRLSILFGVLYGAVIFKEVNIAVRLTGALLMVSGAVLIVLKGV
jgi:drug/metabolite transporter (DMT)-like permease